MIRKPYPTDLTDAQWARIAPLIPPAKPGGRRRSVNLREIVNAIVYFVRTGCQWRNLPHDFPPWGTRFIITSAVGAWTEPGRRFTTLCASSLEPKKRGVRLLRARLS
jgi:transposase